MRVLLWEELGAACSPDDGPRSWHSEGRAMRDSFAWCLNSLENVSVDMALHPAQPNPQVSHRVRRIDVETNYVDHWLAQNQNDYEALLVIAPETAGILEQRITQLEKHDNIINCSAEFIRCCTNKFEMAGRLARWSIPTLSLTDSTNDDFFKFQHRHIPPNGFWLIKPIDGAGSLSTYKIKSSTGSLLELSYVESLVSSLAIGSEKLIIQPFIDGQAVSIAGIGDGSGKILWMPVCEQHLQYDVIDDLELSDRIHAWRLRYLGGAVPVLDRRVQERAQFMADAVLQAMGPARGPVGLDLIISPDQSSSHDRLVEINPRATLAWLGYISAQRNHQPLLSQWASWLLGLPTAHPNVESANWPRVTFESDGSVHRPGRGVGATVEIVKNGNHDRLENG